MDKLVKSWRLFFITALLSCGLNSQHASRVDTSAEVQTLSLEQQYEQRKAAYASDPTADNLIWFGRFTAYLGDFEEAIGLYSLGAANHPNDARFLRHRGHRYISLRQFDKAIDDLKQASEMVEGLPDQVEPDGMPNAQNIPVSTLHTNIWYHLGLAYYLNHDFDAAEQAYLVCRQVGNNDDNWVSASHWLFSIALRMGSFERAKKYVSDVHDSMEVIENHSYQNLCLYYQGSIEEEDLINQASSAGSAADAILYGLANWHTQLGSPQRGHELMRGMLNGEVRASFGYIAAEVDLKALDDVN